jgi:hypothetical protein
MVDHHGFGSVSESLDRPGQDRMPAVLEKLPKAVFEELLTQADDLLRSLLGSAPPVLGQDVRSAAERDARAAALREIAYELHHHGPQAAQDLARALAERLGDAARQGSPK